MNYLYLQVNFFAVIVPFLFSFHPKIKFYKEWKAVFPALLITAFFFLIWDVLFTHLQVWGFNPRYITGYKIINLPIEEILFFICIPYSCLFTYHCLKTQVFKTHKPLKSRVTYLFSLSLITISILFYDKWYTASTSFLLGAFLFFVVRYLKVNMRNFYLTYLLLLLPFIIVNGILTGTGIDEQVVWYNNAENLGLRLLTIPVEDIFYGMLMIFSSLVLWERFAEKRDSNKL